MCSKNIEHAQKNFNLVKIIFELADGIGITDLDSILIHNQKVDNTP